MLLTWSSLERHSSTMFVRAGQDTDCTFNSSADYNTMNVEYMQFTADTGSALDAYVWTRRVSATGSLAHLPQMRLLQVQIHQGPFKNWVDDGGDGR